MTQREREAILSICLWAAMADGIPNDTERARLQGIAAELGAGETGQPYAAAYQRVILGTSSLAQEAGVLTTAELRTHAYEMAVATCNADGVTTPGEKQFLDQLATELKIGPHTATNTVSHAESMANADVHAEPFAGAAATPPPLTGPLDPSASEQELNDSILRYAIINGAIELLPQGIATAAVIPLQMKMVYGIGKRYGYELDAGHIREFLMTVGVGAASQVVESFARRVVGGAVEHTIGGLLGHTLGRVLETVTNKGTGVAFSFGTTYALGHAARQYYAGGRKLSSIDLQTIFTQQKAAAEDVYRKMMPRIQEQARNLDPMRIMNMVRG